jgi:thiol-disulfide isomerase/thioredoxin
MLIASMLTLTSAACAAGPVDLKTDGAFGFPQAAAVVLCDTPDLRLSAACDGKNLFVQAVLWKDNDAAPGLTDDGRKIGDNSTLVVDADADGAITKDVDRNYALDPWPSLPGLHYSVQLGGDMSTGLQGDSKGRGSIQYVDSAGGKVRVDTYLIPLDEIKRAPADHVKIGYWASSTTPDLVVNSVGFVPTDPAKKYWPHNLPLASLHDVDLKAATRGGAAFDAQAVPEGRGTIQVKAQKSMPKVGALVGAPDGPPEIAAQAWKNWKGAQPPTLASLKGKVVVVEFWATWCGPCVKGIPHLNELHKKHAADGLVILSLTDQDKNAVEKFVDERGEGMSYAVGMGSEAVRDYGVSGIPHAFVIGRDGRLVWSGHPGGTEMDGKIEAALKAR